MFSLLPFSSLISYFCWIFTVLLQEELSNQISTLIHSFHSIDGRKFPVFDFIMSCDLILGTWEKPFVFPFDDDDDDVLFTAELLYLESFLQTFKREWTGIDRLRMDKFFQVSAGEYEWVWMSLE